MMRMLHHSPTRSRLRAIGHDIFTKLKRVHQHSSSAGIDSSGLVTLMMQVNLVCLKETFMPLAKIHIKDGQYDDKRLNKVSKAIQDALISVLGVPPEDF